MEEGGLGVREMIDRSREAGERFVVATALEGRSSGAQLLIWSAGHTFGDLGWPRLNQRVALYGEQLLERGAVAPAVKRFDVPGTGKIQIRIEPG